MSRDVEILKQWKHRDLNCVALKMEFGFSWHPYINGYVAIPKSHPLFGASQYDPHPATAAMWEKVKDEPLGKRGIIPLFIAVTKPAELPPIDVIFDVHGSITYGGKALFIPEQKDELWWFGFDTNHLGDEDICQDLDYIVRECEKLADQLLEVQDVNQ